jgi:hypothetical protein
MAAVKLIDQFPENVREALREEFLEEQQKAASAPREVNPEIKKYVETQKKKEESEKRTIEIQNKATKDTQFPGFKSPL